jgi:hypothetical protein
MARTGKPNILVIWGDDIAEALDKAAEYGITIVSMKQDWKAVFA